MKNILVPALCVLAIAVSVVWTYRNQSQASARFDPGPYCALGTGVAEETAKLVPAKGQVIVFVPDTSQSRNETIEGELKCCEAALKQKGLSVTAIVTFKLTIHEKMASGGAVPANQLLAALPSHPNVAALVLLCAFPALSEQECDALKRTGVKCIVSSGYFPAYRRLLETQALHAAIVPRLDRGSAGTEKPKTLRESFEAQFTVVTPENVKTLPY